MRIACLLVIFCIGCGDDDTSVDVDAATVLDAGSVDAMAVVDAGGSDGGQDADAGSDAGPLTPRDPFDGIGTVEPAATAAPGGGDFQFLEGPAWWPGPGVLIFSDIPASTLYQLTPPDTVEVFRPASSEANGNTVGPTGDLFTCEHASREVTRTPPGGSAATVVGRYMGMRFNSPNDLAVRRDGTIYFTDPPYGLGSRMREVGFNGVYRVDPGGAVTAEWMGDADDTRPNGIVLSPRELTLYVADTAKGLVRAFDVRADGVLSAERPFVTDTPNADGMAMDTTGNLYVTTANGVQVYANDGTPWGTIDVPQRPANCGFGDDDKQTLYITARTGLYRVRIPIPGI